MNEYYEQRIEDLENQLYLSKIGLKKITQDLLIKKDEDIFYEKIKYFCHAIKEIETCLEYEKKSLEGKK